MPRHSPTENVTKICGCAKWKACTHPWYISHQSAKGRFRPNLDKLIGRHAADFAEAKTEARRAIVAWEADQSAADLLPMDKPTLAGLMAEYGKRPDAPAAEKFHVNVITRTIVMHPDGPRRFGDWLATEVTAAALEAFRAQRPKVAGNRNLAYLRAMFNWAVVRGFVAQSPFKVGHVAVVKLAREHARTRRLQADEDIRLLEAARGLRDLVVAALETGCREGELLSLQWHQVRFLPKAELFLPGTKTKAKKDRRIPVSSVLRQVLDARRLDPDGELLSADAFVFGDEIGRRRKTVKTAWRLTCRRAKIVNLHFHDLRREAGSRWMDAGVPLATIQRWLGHHNISQTSTYLGASLGGDEQDMRAFEAAAGRLANVGVSSSTDSSDAIRSNSETSEKTQSIVIVPEPTGMVM